MEEAPTSQVELELLLDAIYARYHHDFRDYARASLQRRLKQAQLALGCPTLTRLQERLLHEPEFFPRLLQYLTVPVSDLFRDPAYYRSLREKVVPLLHTYPSASASSAFHSGRRA